MRTFLLRLVAFLILFTGVGELFFRFIIPARQSPIVRQEPDYNLMQFDPKAVSNGLFTSGRWAEQQSRWHINDLGWNSDLAYKPTEKGKRSVIAIAGDSQIEGFYVEHHEHVIRRVQSLSGDRIVGYSLASAGYKLAEYVQVARYLAHHSIQPSVFVMYINRGDFWRSVIELGGRRHTPSPRFSVKDGVVTMEPGGTYGTSWYRRLLRRSAIVRYLVFNARLNPLRQGTADLGMTRRNRYPEENAASNPVYETVARYVVREIRKALPATRIAFLVDADRRSIRVDESAQPIGTSAVIKRVCDPPWCLHVDLTTAFTDARKRHRRSFSFEANYHWNAYSHDLAARALYGRLREAGWLPKENSPKR